LLDKGACPEKNFGMGAGMKIVSTPTPQPEHNHLAEIADNSLSSFDRIAYASGGGRLAKWLGD
jgi:hypothetical protein